MVIRKIVNLLMIAYLFSFSMTKELIRKVKGYKGNKAKVKAAGLAWTIAQSKELKERGVPALHYYTMSRTENIARIAKEVW